MRNSYLCISMQSTTLATTVREDPGHKVQDLILLSSLIIDWGLLLSNWQSNSSWSESMKLKKQSLQDTHQRVGWHQRWWLHQTKARWILWSTVTSWKKWTTWTTSDCGADQKASVRLQKLPVSHLWGLRTSTKTETTDSGLNSKSSSSVRLSSLSFWLEFSTSIRSLSAQSLTHKFWTRRLTLDLKWSPTRRTKILFQSTRFTVQSSACSTKPLESKI